MRWASDRRWNMWRTQPRPFTKTVKDAAGNEVEERGLSFRMCHIYDFSNTVPIEGKEEKAFQPPKAVKPMPPADETLAKLMSFAETVKIPVTYGPMPGTAEGYYSPKEHKIVLKKGVSTGMSAMVLAHELAHALFGHGRPNDKTSTPIKELEAQSVAYVIGLEFGLKGVDKFSFEYLAGWTAGTSRDALKKAGNRIQKISQQIIEGVAALDGVEALEAA